MVLELTQAIQNGRTLLLSRIRVSPAEISYVIPTEEDSRFSIVQMRDGSRVQVLEDLSEFDDSLSYLCVATNSARTHSEECSALV
jgi:hypothetical protein